MSDTNARDVMIQFLGAMNARDWDRLLDLLHPDYVEDQPQSGERIRGPANLMGIIQSVPGGFDDAWTDTEPRQLVGADDRWVMTPSFTVLKVTGASDAFTAVSRAHYPDGSDWFVISIVKLLDGKIHRLTTYFAPVYPAPEWRAPWVEPIT